MFLLSHVERSKATNSERRMWDKMQTSMSCLVRITGRKYTDIHSRPVYIYNSMEEFSRVSLD